MAPEDSTTEDSTTEAGATPIPAETDGAGTNAGAASATPARKRAPRRATKKASAPSTTTTRASRTTKAAKSAEASTAGPDATGQSEGQTSSQGELAFAEPEASAADSSSTASAVRPAKKATRKRVTRKQVAPEASGPATRLDAETSGRTENPNSDDTASAASEDTGPGLSVLFQAPAPAASDRPATSRRRRAAAPAGAPGTSETSVSPPSRQGSRRGTEVPDVPADDLLSPAEAVDGQSPATRTKESSDRGSASDRAEKADKADKPATAVKKAKSEKGSKGEKGSKAEKAGKAGKAEKTGKAKTGKAKGAKGDRVTVLDDADLADEAGGADLDDDAAAIGGDHAPAADAGRGSSRRRTVNGGRAKDSGRAGSASGAGSSDSDTSDDAVEDDTGAETAGSAEAAGDDDDATPRRSRRRRGGKGRRGRGSSGGNDGNTANAGNDGNTTNAGADGRASGGNADDDASTGAGAAADDEQGGSRSQRSNGPAEADGASDAEGGDDESASSRRRRRRRRTGGSSDDSDDSAGSGSGRTRTPRARSEEPTAVRGSTRLEAKKQRRREGREAGRRRTVITEAEFLARREAVDRVMVVRNKDGRTQMGVLEDGVLVEHYIDQATNVSMAGNIYLGRVQNVLPSMEAAFVDIGKGRNAVLYAGEVNWDAAGLEGNQPKRIENALGSGQTVLVQVTKDPIGHKGARLTSQISLPGRYLVYVPNSSMTGISRKLPDTERARLKKILRDVVPDSAGVIVRTAAEGASEAELRADVERLTATWEQIQAQAEASSSGKAGKSKGRKSGGGSGSSPTGTAPLLLHGEPDLTVRVIRDVFNEDFTSLVVSGEQAWEEIHPYISSVAPDLADRVSQWTGTDDLFTHHRVDEQLAKAMDRKVWLPSGGSLVIDRTEAMTVVDVNTGKFVGSGGNLEETVTKNNIEAAEEIVRQLRLRDIGGIIVVDFIDMVLEANRDLVVRRLLECLGRDRTKHQVAEVTSLGLVQMTRKRVGSGLIEVFGETCEPCNGRGFIIHSDPVDRGAGSGSGSGETSSTGNANGSGSGSGSGSAGGRSRRGRAASSGSSGASAGGGSGAGNGGANGSGTTGASEPTRGNGSTGPTAAMIAAAAHAAALKTAAGHPAPQVAQAATSIADEVAAELASNAASLGIDQQVQDQLTSAPETTESVPPETQPEGESGSEPDQQPETQPEPSSPGPRARRRRGRVMAPAGPPRESGTSQE